VGFSDVPFRAVNLQRLRAPVRRFGTAITNDSVTLIAACRDDQTSADAWIENDHRGALTWALWTTLSSRAFDVTHLVLVKQAGRWLTSHGFDQVPQLECSPQRRAWRFLAPAPGRAMTGRRRDEGHARLGA
jgi:hypothetical protein